MTIDLEIPTTILTQFGVTDCLPKLARDGTRNRSDGDPHGYTKRHGDKTSNPMSSDPPTK
jgi:hypothetical protein